MRFLTRCDGKLREPFVWHQGIQVSIIHVFVTPWTVAHQALLPLGFSRHQEGFLRRERPAVQKLVGVASVNSRTLNTHYALAPS